MGKEEAAETEMVITNLPEEIQVQIFLKLPVSSIISSRKVCKIWRSLLRSRNFIQTHIDHGIRNPKLMLISHGFKTYRPNSIFRSLDYYVIGDMPPTSSTVDEAVPMDNLIRDMIYDSVIILGSCNGLICMALNTSDICIWNPSTGEYKKMQVPFCDPLMAQLSLVADENEIGFCYDCVADEYKLVRLDGSGTEGSGQVDIFTLGSSEPWKRIQSTNHTIFPVNEFNAACFLKGALHWLGVKSSINEARPRVIVTFDARSERFADFSIPQEAQLIFTLETYDNLGVLEDCLSFVRNDTRVSVSRLDIWLMQDYGVNDSWTKRYSFSTKMYMICGHVKLLWSFTNGELVIDAGYGTWLYDSKNDKFRVLKIQGVDDVRDGVPLNYVESFVSPNLIGKGIVSTILPRQVQDGYSN